jgi:hypothetical protein
MREAHWRGVCVCRQARPGFEAGHRYAYEAHWREGAPVVSLVSPGADPGAPSLGNPAARPGQAVRLTGDEFDRHFVRDHGGRVP